MKREGVRLASLDLERSAGGWTGDPGKQDRRFLGGWREGLGAQVVAKKRVMTGAIVWTVNGGRS